MKGQIINPAYGESSASRHRRFCPPSGSHGCHVFPYLLLLCFQGDCQALICDVQCYYAAICPVTTTGPSKQELTREPNAEVANMLMCDRPAPESFTSAATLTHSLYPSASFADNKSSSYRPALIEWLTSINPHHTCPTAALINRKLEFLSCKVTNHTTNDGGPL